MSNQTYSHLTVIELDIKSKPKKERQWLCKCDCGNPNLISTRGSSLRNGHTKSCGECAFYQIKGKKYGKLKVIERDLNKSGNLICKCDCGNIISVSRSHLLSGHTKSCGCLKIDKSKENMIGKRFGLLTVIEATNQRDYKQSIIWKCKCDCGNITYANTDILNKGQKNSCGCLKISTGELRIKQLLDLNNISYEREKRFKDLLKYRFDFYVEDKYVIEFDGEQHFHSETGGWNTEEHLKKLQMNDAIKNQWCKDNHIPIIRIPYYFKDNITIEDLKPESSTFLLYKEDN